MNHEQQLARCQDRLLRCRGRMDLLEAELGRADAKLREDLTRELRALRRSYRLAEGRLARARLGAAEAWAEEDFGTGLFAIFDDLGRRIDQLFARAG